MRDITRLPKWAQTEIEKLQRRIGELERQRHNWTNQEIETDVWGNTHHEVSTALPPGIDIAFQPGVIAKVEKFRSTLHGVIRVRGVTGPYLHPHIEISTAGDKLAVEPVSANMVKIRAVGWDE
jgi:hypothetical protein